MNYFKKILFIIAAIAAISSTFFIIQNRHPHKESQESQIKAENQTISKLPTIESDSLGFMSRLFQFSSEHDISIEEYPDHLIELAQKNPETEQFVLDYPLKKNTYSTKAVTEALGQKTVPLFMQWDSRWGYYPYSGDVIGTMGCGPVCLSMVTIHLLQDPKYTPVYIADYAVDKGYCVPGSGTAWTLMSSGAEGLGLHAEEVPLDENRIKQYLENGSPIICVVGPGDFTTDGHFLVFTSVKDGKIKINDPNNTERSEKLWSYEELKGQIRNMWAYSAN